VSPSRIGEILDFLISVNLVKRSPELGLAVGEARLFLGADSPLISKHHINWRLQAIQSLENETSGVTDELHYSSTWSISNGDLTLVKSEIVKFLERLRQTLKASENEEAICLNLDFFKL
jgi:hypothetical protein